MTHSSQAGLASIRQASVTEMVRSAMESAWDEGYFAGLDRNGYHGGPDLNPHRPVS